LFELHCCGQVGTEIDEAEFTKLSAEYETERKLASKPSKKSAGG
jgi:hypothetical protein